MAKEVSKNMLHKKSGPKAKKEASKDVKTGSLGIGDAYAYGVKELVENMKNEQGSSQTSWLGVQKESIDVNECVDRQKLNCKGK